MAHAQAQGRTFIIINSHPMSLFSPGRLPFFFPYKLMKEKNKRMLLSSHASIYWIFLVFLDEEITIIIIIKSITHILARSTVARLQHPQQSNSVLLLLSFFWVHFKIRVSFLSSDSKRPWVTNYYSSVVVGVCVLAWAAFQSG